MNLEPKREWTTKEAEPTILKYSAELDGESRAMPPAVVPENNLEANLNDKESSADRTSHNRSLSPMFANSPPLSLDFSNNRCETASGPRKNTIEKIELITSRIVQVMSWICQIGIILSIVYLCFITISQQLQEKHYVNSIINDPSVPYNQFLLPPVQQPEFITFLRNAVPNGINDQVLQVLPFAAFATLIAFGIAALAIYFTRPRQIICDDKNLVLEGSGPVMIGIKWGAIKHVEQFRTWDPFNGKKDALAIETMGGHQFRIKVSDIARHQDIGTFFNKIRMNAPNAVLKIADEVQNADPSYTQLWLKYFSAPTERNNKGLLTSGMVLDNGRYQVVETVGGGGQGTAYLANCISKPFNKESQPPHFVEGAENEPFLINGGEIVLKEYVLPVHRGELTAEKTADKLKAEAAILRRLDHPQIVKILDGFIEDYRGYLVLEYVRGETLKTLVERLGPQSESEVIDWAKQVTEILIYLHSLTPSVVHRDITPDNLIRQEDGVVKLVDFNVAHQVDSSSTSTVVGKHAYIPPEQFRGKPNAQSDIYALGGTMFFLLSGVEPEPITMSKLKNSGVNVSDKMDALVAKCTSLDLTKRYQTAEELLEALSEISKEEVTNRAH